MFLHALFKVVETDECIEWPNARSEFGHGVCSLNRKVAAEFALPRTIMAHRASYLQNVGAIPKGFVVRHSCHKPSCINPRHLSTGTQKDNVWDSIRDGRIPTKLTEETARAIKASTGSQRKVAAQYGVSQTVVWHIRNGSKWRHINGTESPV